MNTSNRLPWQWILVAGGLCSIIVGSLPLGLGLGAFGMYVLWKKVHEEKSDGQLRIVNHRWIFRSIQPLRFPQRLNRVMPFPARKRHALYIGQSGSGKSSLLKLRIASDLSFPGAIMVIDAHGDLVREMARLRLWEQQPERLVYLTPTQIKNGIIPAFNPFEASRSLSPQDLSLRVSELSTAFEALFRDQLTHHMKLMIKRVTALLLHRPGHTILDLLRIVEPGGEDIALKLCNGLLDETLVRYFQDTFLDYRLKVSKHAVAGRLGDVLENHAVRSFLGQTHSSFDIQGLLNSGKVILFDLSQAVFGVAGAKIIGSFLLAEIGSMALGRASKASRRGVWIYADECPLYITSSMGKLLSETRKFGVHFSLACQHLSQFSGTGLERLKDSVLNNTGLKVIGASAQKDLQALSKEAGFDPSHVRSQLTPGRFVISSGNSTPLLYTAPDYLILKKKHQTSGNRYHISESTFQNVLASQQEEYYQKKPPKPSSSSQSSSSPPPLDPL